MSNIPPPSANPGQASPSADSGTGHIAARGRTMQPTPGTGNTTVPGLADRFPWRLFWFSLAVIVLGNGFSVELHTWVDAVAESSPCNLAVALFFTALAAAGLWFCARTLFRNRFSRAPVIPALVGALLCGHWLALDAHHFVETFHWHPLALAGIGAVLVLVFSWLLHHWRSDLETGRSLKCKPAKDWLDEGNIARALVLTISKPNCTIMLSPSQEIHAHLSSGEAKVDLTGQLTEDLKAIDKSWKAGVAKPNWQQLMRAVEPHVGNLKCVYLLGSGQSRLQDAKLFLRPYLPENQIEILDLAPPKNLEDFDEVLALLRNEVITPLARKSVKPHQIAIDITGGFKIPSVAGAVLTLNRTVVCQYVQSTGSEAEKKESGLRPYIYDFRWDKSLELP
ncbi:MAG: hypothetical protein WBN75_13950 [Verrucomicrobiia bacterium]